MLFHVLIMFLSNNLHLCLRDDLCDLLAGVERGHFNVSHPPVSSPRCLQNLIMFLQDLPETGEVQVLQGAKERETEGERERGAF